jgi:hypothetical protein
MANAICCCPPSPGSIFGGKSGVRVGSGEARVGKRVFFGRVGKGVG